jgi:hypothetical protein
MNSSTTTAPLCLACSSSLPPRLWKRTAEQHQRQQGTQSGQTSSSASGSSDSELLFLTRCCGRPICPSCLTSNPRLARYNPCLACLGGVGAVGTKKLQGQQHPLAMASNVDGAVRDEDVFVLGDEDEDGASSESDDGEAGKASGAAPPPYEGARPPEPDVQVRPYAEPDKLDGPTASEPTDNNQGSPGRYYIRPDDTLLGISLRLGVEVSTNTTSLPAFVWNTPSRQTGPNALQAERPPTKYATHDATLTAHTDVSRPPAVALTTTTACHGE